MNTVALARHLMSAPGVTNVRHVSNHEPSFWLRCKLTEIDTAAINGRVRSCGHGGVGIVALWQPDRFCCPMCASQVLRLEGEANWTCDRCARVAESISVHTIAGRLAVVIYGLCPDCSSREVAA